MVCNVNSGILNERLYTMRLLRNDVMLFSVLYDRFFLNYQAVMNIFI